MTLPLWVAVGAAVQPIAEGPGHPLFITDTTTNRVLLQKLNGVSESNRVGHKEFLDSYEPHRWIATVDVLRPPSRVRANYRDGKVWEARIAQAAPPWFVDRGLYMIERGKAIPVRIQSLTRTGVTVEGGRVVSFEDMHLSWLPTPYPLEVGSTWSLTNDLSIELRIASVNDDGITVTSPGIAPLLCNTINDLVAFMDPRTTATLDAPRWLVPGAKIEHCRSERIETVRRISSEDETLLITVGSDVLSLGQVLLAWAPTGEEDAPRPLRARAPVTEWEPEESQENGEEGDEVEVPEGLGMLFSRLLREEGVEETVEGLEGSFWAWRSPPALLEVIADLGTGVCVSILPSEEQATMKAEELSANAVRLRHRSRTATPRNFRWGRGIFLDVPGGPIVVEKIEGREVLLLSPTSLEELDGLDIVNATALRQEPPKALIEDEELWEEKKTRRRCHAHNGPNGVTIRWLSAKVQEEVLPKDKFLARFRPMSESAETKLNRAIEESSGPGGDAWGLLFKD